ncbi:hypothetical protein A2U01_0014228 [Trifolium medium]|uniref:Uncharacterized protein n=1 Tax=Trifolium medium TaxID=97028 RepID=A0A392N0F0_9FABA|nr:hypothetical protein [Trifolium medium]
MTSSKKMFAVESFVSWHGIGVTSNVKFCCRQSGAYTFRQCCIIPVLVLFIGTESDAGLQKQLAAVDVVYQLLLRLSHFEGSNVRITGCISFGDGSILVLRV